MLKLSAFISINHPHKNIKSLEYNPILNKLITSAKYSGMAKEDKFKFMDNILEPRGFKRAHAGTNRIVYRNEYNDSFLIKIAIDSGLKDRNLIYISKEEILEYIKESLIQN